MFKRYDPQIPLDFEAAEDAAVERDLQAGLPEGTKLGSAFKLNRTTFMGTQLMNPEEKKAKRQKATRRKTDSPYVSPTAKIERPATSEALINVLRSASVASISRILKQPTLQLIAEMTRDWIMTAPDGGHSANQAQEMSVRNNTMQGRGYLVLAKQHLAESDDFRARLQSLLDGYVRVGGAKAGATYEQALNAMWESLHEKEEEIELQSSDTNIRKPR